MAAKMAKTGYTHYLQQRLVDLKASESDVMVCYDGTVHNSLGDLIQFIQPEGEDRTNSAFVERQKIDTFGMSDEEFKLEPPACTIGGIGDDDCSLALRISAVSL
jgi:DNA-directed RNA polymerase beta' subunit